MEGAGGTGRKVPPLRPAPGLDSPAAPAPGDATGGGRWGDLRPPPATPTAVQPWEFIGSPHPTPRIAPGAS